MYKLFLALITSLVIFSQPAMSAPVTNGPVYYVIAKNSDKCAHVHGGGKKNGANITQWECKNQPNIKWNFFNAGGRFFYMKSAGTDKCLHVHGAGNNNGANITQWECKDLPHMKWEFRYQGSGYYKIRAKHSEKCMHIHGGGIADGGNITQWNCNLNQNNLLWRLKRVHG